MLLLSPHLDWNWYFQKQHNGMGNGNAERQDSPLLVIQLCTEKTNTSFPSCPLQQQSPRDSITLKNTANCCCSFFFMPGSYFLLKLHFIRMLQLSTLDRRKGRNADLVPAKVLRMWQSCITDLLSNRHNLPMDIRQLWFSPVLFGSKWMKIRDLRCSLPRRCFRKRQVGTAHAGPWAGLLGWRGTPGQRGKQTWWKKAQCYWAGVQLKSPVMSTVPRWPLERSQPGPLQTRVGVGRDGWGPSRDTQDQTPPSATASYGFDPRSKIHASILLTIKTKVFQWLKLQKCSREY